MRTNFSAADTEGDVENFFVLPLLTDVAFCGIPEVALRSKQSLATYEIDKGRTRKRYVPDYVVYAEGLPVCVVEVKRPDERLDDAYAEAQLYAHKLNKKITGADPAFYVMATNGGELWVGYWNVDSPAVKIDASDLLPGSRNLDALQRMIAWDRLQEHSTKHASQVLPAEWMLPSEWLGENRVTLAKAGHNSLYSDLDPILRRYFNPKDTELEEKIIQYAYVPTGDVTKYERSFEDFLRTRIIPLADAEGTEIETTKRASPNFQARLEDAFRKRRPFMQLVIGGVGSGKTSFLRRFFGHMLAKDVINRTVYCRINFNTASDDLKDIREWVCEQFIEIVRNKYSHVVDLGTSDGLLNVFSKEIKDNSGAYNFLKKSSSEKYNERIGDDMLKWMADKPTFARAIARSISGDRGYTIVIAFDNVDRRERESQLSIFQTGQWFMDLTRSVCIMTLRDETFETYKDEKPLDAFLKTGNFYIRPPRFVDMVSKRLDLVIRDLSEKNIAGTHSYELAGIGTVKYPATSIGTYLTAVYVDLFRKKRKITLVLEGLSGRNARKSLEMFSAVLTSAHFDTKDFTSAALTYGSHHIQETTLLRALMRTNYLYFKPDHGFVRNIYDFPINSKNPNHFLKFELLLFLVDHRKKPGDVRFEGYFSVGYLVKLFVSRGFVDVDIIYTLNDMIFAELIVSENLTLKPLELRTAVRVRSSGYIHAKVLAHRAEYVSGCALVTPIGDRAYAERIGALWQITDPHTDARAQNKREAASCFAEYLEVQLQKRGDQVGIKETEQAGSLLIKFAKEALQFTPSSSTKEPRQPMADHEEQEFDRLFTE